MKIDDLTLHLDHSEAIQKLILNKKFKKQMMDYGKEFEKFAIKDQGRSEEHTSELQSRLHLVCRLLLEKKNIKNKKGKPTNNERYKDRK